MSEGNRTISQSVHIGSTRRSPDIVLLSPFAARPRQQRPDHVYTLL